MNTQAPTSALALRDPWAMVPAIANLDAYITAVNRLPMLTPEEESQFATRLRDQIRVARAIDHRLGTEPLHAALVRDAATYEATRPAMAFREDAMKRRFADARAIFPGRIALMAHAMHLAKDDNLINAPGAVGPGGRLTPSLGHHIVQELGLKAYAVWMIYGGGEDSQPLKDLPNKARFPSHTLNARMARLFDQPTVVSLEGAPDVSYAIGHLYNTLFETRLKAQADAVWFTPKVTPMRLG